MLHFGIGCFSLELDPAIEAPAARWAQTVETGLNSLASVEDVRVGVSGFLPRLSEVNTSDPFDLSKAPRSFVPQPQSGRVGFSLRVPARLRKDLHPSGNRECGENFHVQILYGLYGPSTMVFCLDDLPHRGGSDAVVVVREFLKAELKGPDGLHLVNLGPSPFHTDGTVEPSDGSGFSCEVLPGPYSLHKFKYGAGDYSTDLEAAKVLHVALAKELGAFYGLVRSRNRRLHRATQVGAQSEKLIAAHRAKGTRASFDRLFRTGRDARELGLNVLSAELAVAQDREAAEQRISSVYATSEIRAFRYNIDRTVAEEFPELPAHAKEVVRLLESGRTKELEVALVSASTILGGVAGAAAALIAAG